MCFIGIVPNRFWTTPTRLVGWQGFLHSHIDLLFGQISQENQETVFDGGLAKKFEPFRHFPKKSLTDYVCFRVFTPHKRIQNSKFQSSAQNRV